MQYNCKLTPEVIEKAKELANQGQPGDTVAASLGIARRTWNRWKEQAKSDYESQKETIYRDLWAALEWGKSQFIQDNLAIIHKAAQRDWHAAAWLLERRIPEHFAVKQEVNASVEGITIKNDLPKAEEIWQSSVSKTS